MSREEEWARATSKQKFEAYVRFYMSPGFVLMGLAAIGIGAWLALRN